MADYRGVLDDLRFRISLLKNAIAALEMLLKVCPELDRADVAQPSTTPQTLVGNAPSVTETICIGAHLHVAPPLAPHETRSEHELSHQPQ